MKTNNQVKVLSKTPSAVLNGGSGEFLSMHQASKMTGYHQDYLGQLARSGKLEAHKVGRNWFTTKLAIDKMLGRVSEESEISVGPEIVVKPLRPVKPELEEIPETTVVNLKKSEPVRNIKIHNLSISKDAGPNLQESLSLPVIEKVEVIQRVRGENKNFYYKWQKLVRPEQKYKLQLQRIKNELVEVTEELSKTKNTKVSFSWKYALAGFACMCFTIVGTAYLVSNYFSDVSDSLSTQINAQEKRVAGEATDVYSSNNEPTTIEPEQVAPRGID